MKQWELLKKSVEARAFSHAYLFSGNDDASKQEAAIKFAMLFACQNAKQGEPCLKCSSCKSMRNLEHPDLVIVKPLIKEGEEAKEITIGQVRELLLRVSVSPWAMPFTFVLFKDAHLINQEAQSALLKLLENPKGNIVFFFFSEYPLMILETVRSRMQEMRFWKFPSLQEESAKAKEEMREFERLKKKTLHEKFLLAKELSESQSLMQSKIMLWISCARILMLQDLARKASGIQQHAKILRLLQETRMLLNTTNASPRLLLEGVMLEL
ncbi:MAG: hypothetical protein HYS60_02560 [Candidatus Wildermuthbacteria bacterium]|nr:hypothetical protein [Candidatus Wildermuthbacteria bacterium]